MTSRSSALVRYRPTINRLDSLNRRACVLDSSLDRIWMEALEPRTMLSGGQLDTTFGNNGIASAFAGQSAFINALAVLPDDKILAVGQASQSPALALFNPDGSLDTSFGSGGTVITPLPGQDTGSGTKGHPATGYDAVVPQADGKILLAGDLGDGFLLARYHADGSLDPTFGQGGLVIMPQNNIRLTGLAVESDGQILATFGIGFSDPQMGVLRFNPDGSLDTSFGADGIAAVQGNTSDFDEQADLATVGADGSITLFGQADGGIGHPPAANYVAQLTPGGQETSIQQYQVESKSFWGIGATQSSDGKVVMLNGYLSRFDADGTPDDTFGSDGSLGPLSQTQEDLWSTVGVRSDGAIFVLGENYLLERYNPDGIVDTRFGDGGMATITLPNSNEDATAIGFQSNGDIIVGGDAFDLIRIDAGTDPTPPEPTMPTTLQYPVAVPPPSQDPLAQAQLVHFAATDLIGGTVSAAAVEPNGQILAAGSCVNDTAQTNQIALALFNADGTLDTSFGDGGTVTTSIGGDGVEIDSVALLPQGQFLVAGEENWGDSILLARYHSDGTLDTSFGDNGIVNAAPPSGLSGQAQYEQFHGVTVGPDGSIAVWGGDGDSFIARFNADGSPDVSFGTGDTLANVAATVTSVTVNPDGSLVAAVESPDANYNQIGRGILFSSTGQEIGVKPGLVENSTNSDYAPLATLSDGSTLAPSNYGFSLVRAAPGVQLYTGDGDTVGTTVVQSAGPAPLATFDLDTVAGNTDREVSAAAVQPNGQIIVAGFGGGDIDPNPGISIARFNADGTADTSFGEGGAVNIQGSDYNLLGYLFVAAQSACVLPDGQIQLACFGSPGVGAPGSLVLMRFDTDGSPDDSFGNGGIVQIPLSIPPAQESFPIVTMAMAGDGSTLAYGSSGNQVLLAHFNADGSVDSSFGNDGVVSMTASASDIWETPAAVTFNADGSMLVTISGQDAWGDSVAYNLVLSATGQQLSLTAATPVPANTYTPLLRLPNGSTLSISPDGSSLLQYAAGVDPTKPIYTGFTAPWDPPPASPTSSTPPSASTDDAADLNRYVRPISAFASQAGAPADGFASILASSNPLASFSHAIHKPDDWMASGGA